MYFRELISETAPVTQEFENINNADNNTDQTDSQPSDETNVSAKKRQKKNSIMSAFEEAMFKMHEEKILKEAERNKTEHELKLKILEIEHNKSMELMEVKKRKQN